MSTFAVSWNDAETTGGSRGSPPVFYARKQVSRRQNKCHLEFGGKSVSSTKNIRLFRAMQGRPVSHVVGWPGHLLEELARIQARASNCSLLRHHHYNALCYQNLNRAHPHVFGSIYFPGLCRTLPSSDRICVTLTLLYYRSFHFQFQYPYLIPI